MTFFTFWRKWPYIYIYESKKFFHQQNLYHLRIILTIYNFVISPIEKKLSPFQVPKIVIYWVLDDRIIIYCRYIAYRAIRWPGGDWNVFTGFWPHFALNRAFLSRQEVPGCHKNIYRELRPSFTRSEIFGNICCCFQQQKQHSLLTLHVDISLWPAPK